MARARRRIVLRAQSLGLPVSLVGNRDVLDTSTWPEFAPYTITAKVFDLLRSRTTARLYDLNEEVLIRGGTADVLIGHPFPGKDRKTWNRSCREGSFCLRFAMLPLSHGMAEINGDLDPYIPMVDAVFGIMGPYWQDTWGESPFAHWREKIIPLDMAVDSSRIPRVKKRFNPPGKRKFFYIGGHGPQKGTHLLSILFGLSGIHKCIWIGNGPMVRNVERRPWALFTEEYLQRLAEECDVFITLGVSDANPTTILECMAWGFPVCCTPQSGYYNMAEIETMSITDMSHNQEVLDRMQSVPEEQLLARADAARRLVESRFTWDRFRTAVLSGIESVAGSKGLDPWKK